MVTKRYEGDWAKSKARTLLRDMIGSTLLTFRKPEDLRVLCFPGIDAVEIHEVYDPLRIPRENIVGIERDPEIAQKIRSRNLGIQLIGQGLEEYVHKEDKFSLDIISLDYTGPIQKGQTDSQSEIHTKNNKNHVIFHTANLLKRDHRSKALYVSASVSNSVRERDRIDVTSTLSKAGNLLRGLEEGESVYEEKKEVYSYAVSSTFGAPTGEPERVFRFILGKDYDRIVEMIKKEARERYQVDVDKDLETMGGVIWIHPIFAMMVENEGMNLLSKKLVENEIPKTALFLAFHLIGSLFSEGRYYLTKGVRRYNYISESGAPMIGDIYYISYPERLILLAKAARPHINFPESFEIKNNIGLMRLLRDYEKLASKLKLVRYQENDRTFLGSSAKPVLTKQATIESFKAGKSIDEVKTEFRGWSNKPLAQWKAHVTMGTYDAKTDEREEDKDLETITREEALDLLQSGIPPKEINESYPTSFSVSQLATLQNDPTATITITKEEAIELLATGGVTPEDLIQAYPGTFTIGQLRAFKAHVTMGLIRHQVSSSPLKKAF